MLTAVVLVVCCILNANFDKFAGWKKALSAEENTAVYTCVPASYEAAVVTESAAPKTEAEVIEEADAPQTFDFGVIAAPAFIIFAAGCAASRKKINTNTSQINTNERWLT